MTQSTTISELKAKLKSADRTIYTLQGQIKKLRAEKANMVPKEKIERYKETLDSFANQYADIDYAYQVLSICFSQLARRKSKNALTENGIVRLVNMNLFRK